MSTTCSFIPIADGTTTGHFENVDGSITSRDITITVSKMETVPLKALVGASLSDAISVVEKMSYTATYIHAQSGYDFTEEIKVFDNDQMAKYVITEVDKIDTDKKTVTLKINTQDNIDADTKAKETEAALSVKAFSRICLDRGRPTMEKPNILTASSFITWQVNWLKKLLTRIHGILRLLAP